MALKSMCWACYKQRPGRTSLSLRASWASVAMHRRDAFTMDLMAIPQGAGSGFVYDVNGHIITNYHVIKGASDLQVKGVSSAVIMTPLSPPVNSQTYSGGATSGPVTSHT